MVRKKPDILLAEDNKEKGVDTTDAQVLPHAADIGIGDIDVESVPNCRDLTEASVEELASNIKAIGLLQYPGVRRKSEETIALQEQGRLKGDPDKAFEAIYGFRRILACFKLFRDSKGQLFRTIPCMIVNLTNEQVRFANLAENVQRKSLSFLEEINAFLRLEEAGYSTRKMAENLGLDDSYIAQRLSFRKHAEVDLFTIVERGILPFSLGYRIYTQLGGAEADEKYRAMQKSVALSVVKANEHYLNLAEKGMGDEQERKRTVKETAKKKAQEELQKAETPVSTEEDLTLPGFADAGGPAELSVKEEPAPDKPDSIGEQTKADVEALVKVLDSMDEFDSLDELGRGLRDGLLWVLGKMPGKSLLLKYQLALSSVMVKIKNAEQAQSSAPANPVVVIPAGESVVAPESTPAVEVAEASVPPKRKPGRPKKTETPASTETSNAVAPVLVGASQQ